MSNLHVVKPVFHMKSRSTTGMRCCGVM